jgi:5'-3' exonuclease
MKYGNLNFNKIKGKRLLFIDGNNLLHRCFHGAVNAAPNQQKQLTTLFVLKQILDYKRLCLNSIMVFFFDSEHSYRANLYDFYKQHKLEKIDNFKSEIFNHIRYNIIEKLGIQIISQKGYEGDDLIALYSGIYSKKNKVIIFSTDNDLMQCINNRIIHYNPLKNETCTLTSIKEKMGLNPSELAINKALVGKKNEIPGVPKIGIKTSLKIINKEIPFPDFDKKIFEDYLDASVLPFSKGDIPIDVKEIEQFENTKENFRSLFMEWDFGNFLTHKQMSLWTKAFNLK